MSRMTARKIEFEAPDGQSLRFTRVEPSSVTHPEPVLLVHGAGVRGNIFSPPYQESLDSKLARAGYDVWNLDWRASIEHEPNEWTLDKAAVFDYPEAVKKIREETGIREVKAVVHCQGSTSFMLSLVAGLLPEVTIVISNAVSLHPVVPPRSALKGRLAVPIVRCMVTYLNPQWGVHAPPGWPRILDFLVRATHHECNNPVCKWSSFTYGAGAPTLWRHENLSEEVHEWLKGEFAHVPMSFFRQMTRSIGAGHLVTTGEFEQLPESAVDQAPRTDARVVFLGGELNDCFLPESQARSFDHMEKYAPGRHSYYEMAGYGHLDPFIGKNAPNDVFPLIIDELANQA
ncbi:MAG: alpha/beta hydrolase [Rhodospirillaceae bacterium]|nr:alpha/beta hydrolase [Rhodospirillaceae bacterium]